MNDVHASFFDVARTRAEPSLIKPAPRLELIDSPAAPPVPNMTVPPGNDAQRGRCRVVRGPAAQRKEDFHANGHRYGVEVRTRKERRQTSTANYAWNGEDVLGEGCWQGAVDDAGERACL